MASQNEASTWASSPPIAEETHRGAGTVRHTTSALQSFRPVLLLPSLPQGLPGYDPRGANLQPLVLILYHLTTEIILAPSPDLQPAPFFAPTPKAAKRVLEFFTGQINNEDLQAEVSPPTRPACFSTASRS